MPPGMESRIKKSGRAAPKGSRLGAVLHLSLRQWGLARDWSSPYFSSPLYATSVRHKVRAGAVRGIFESMVELSDTANLMDKFLALPFLRMFMFGEQNDSLNYQGHLEANGVELANIPLSGHFPMYSNAPEMRRRIHDFQARAELEAAAASAPRLASN